MLWSLGYYLAFAFRWLVGRLDGLVYTVDAMLYELMMDIASAKVFSTDTIQDVSMRVYQLLGLVMLFRLIFAFLTYVINPEDMTDKNKGYTKIIKKVFTSLALVIITPWLFTQSRNLQIYIINDKLIEYFIFGTAGSSQAKPGYELMYTVGKIFNTPYKCANDKCEPEDTEKTSCRGTKWDEELKKDNVWKLDGTKHVLSDLGHSSLCAYGASDKDYANSLYEAVHPNAAGEYNLHELMHLVSAGNKPNLFFGEGDWYVEAPLRFIGSTLVGLFVGYVLLSMCMDIALRSVKLAFYEMIAPVPILSNLGMKDGKDSMLNKWFHEVLKTYADLFTRVAGLQIATFAVDELVNNGALEGNSNPLVSLFLIIGALMFAKKLPDILKGMGINFEGGGSFNLKKKFNDEVAGTKFGTKLMQRAGAFGLGAVGGFASNANKVRANLWKAHRDNQALREEMRKQGYTKFNKANREDFYSRNAGTKKQDLGSVRHRRQYLGSKSAIDARKDAALTEHNQRMANLNSEEAKYKANATAEEKENISAHFSNLRQAEIDRYHSYSPGKETRAAKKEFKHDNAADNAYFFGSLGSMIAGTTSSAVRAVTTKDGKLFAGAAEGVKGSNEARDLRDKQQGADYGLGTQIGDKIKTFTGLDTEAKLRSNAMHDQINQMTAVLNTYQNQLNNYASELKPEIIEQIMRNPDNYKDFGSEAEKNYAATLKAYSKQQTEITKAQKKLEKLYESSKK